MEDNFLILAMTALSIGIFHTLTGPDHYVPFVAMSKTRSWSIRKTINIVIICGLGHVLSSVLIGFIGIVAGILLSHIEFVEGIRGNIAAWLLMLFGLSYVAWAVYRLLIRKGHHHHRELEKNDKRTMTFWILFTIFIFGPCEPLIPILMYPAAQNNYLEVMGIAGIFTLATVGTMIISVLLVLRGLSLVKMHILEKYQHILAGSAITLCGAGILFLGL
jgi:nickel/cobalt exporter